jgi:hypothetical protein
MSRYLLALSLFIASITLSVGATAANWPWEESPVDLEYCTGLVVGGLDSRDLGGASRTDLWLAWSYLVRSGAVHIDHATDFATGREQFSNSLDNATVQANLDEADGSCGLGRSGRQVTGW